MQFLIDAQLPPGLARFLVEQGYRAEHVADVGLRDAEDSSIWDYAMNNPTAYELPDDVVLSPQGETLDHRPWTLDQRRFGLIVCPKAFALFQSKVYGPWSNVSLSSLPSSV